jgi:methionyl-tRNA synthetase
MLLAADYTDADGKECVEVLDCSWAAPGTPVVLEGTDPAFAKAEVVDADTFFEVPITVTEKTVNINGKALVADGKTVTTVNTVNGEVH